MSWNYSQNDQPDLPVLATPAAPEPAVSPEGEALARAAQELAASIPAAFADLLQRPDLSPEQKLALVRELVELDQAAQLTDQEVAAASPALRDAARALKEQKEAIAAQEAELAEVLAPTLRAAPAIALASPQPYGLDCGRFPVMDMGPSMGAALEQVFAAGPAPTPDLTLPGRGAGMDRA